MTSKPEYKGRIGSVNVACFGRIEEGKYFLEKRLAVCLQAGVKLESGSWQNSQVWLSPKQLEAAVKLLELAGAWAGQQSFSQADLRTELEATQRGEEPQIVEGAIVGVA